MAKRYALLLCGQARYRKGAVESIMKNIIQHNNVDVFCHFWVSDQQHRNPWRAIADIANTRDDDTDACSAEQAKLLIDALKPIDYKVETQIMFDVDKYHPGREKDHVINSIGEERANQHFKRCNFIVQSMWYSVMRANEIRKEYASVHNIKYDGVMRFRPDIIVPNPIVFDTYDASKLNIPWDGNRYECNIQYGIVDAIAFGKEELMNVYCDNYNKHSDILTHPNIYALIDEYTIGLYISKYVGNENIVKNLFGYHSAVELVHNIQTLRDW